MKPALRPPAPLRRLRASMLSLVMVAAPLAPALGHPAASPASTARAVLRCGWFENPTPGNASLTDRDGEWTIAMQGNFEASGNWPTFKRSQWVQTGHGSAGYGCACLKVLEDDDAHNITHIQRATAQSLAACRRDKSLAEPANPLE